MSIARCLAHFVTLFSLSFRTNPMHRIDLADARETRSGRRQPEPILQVGVKNGGTLCARVLHRQSTLRIILFAVQKETKAPAVHK